MRDITKFSSMSADEIMDCLDSFKNRIINMVELTEEELKDLNLLIEEAKIRGLIGNE